VNVKGGEKPKQGMHIDETKIIRYGHMWVDMRISVSSGPGIRGIPFKVIQSEK
jgi:hypothetical protein